MSAIVNAISAFAQWLLSIVVKFFTALWDFATDLLINGADLFLQALAALIVAIPAPDFLTSYKLQALFNQFTPDLWFFIGQFRITEGVGLLGIAFAVRMTRKLVTLFQW